MKEAISAARPGQRAEERADQRSADRRHPGAADIVPGRDHRAEGDALAIDLARLDRADAVDHFRDAEQPHGDGHQRYSIREVGDVPGERRVMPVSMSEPTMPSSRPSRTMAIPFAGAPVATVEAATRPSTIMEKYSAGPKIQCRTVDDQRREQRHDEDADAGTKEGCHRRHQQRDAGAALARHRVAFKAGDGVGGRTGHVQQDRRDRTAIGRAVIDAGQHHNRGGVVQVEVDT